MLWVVGEWLRVTGFLVIWPGQLYLDAGRSINLSVPVGRRLEDNRKLQQEAT